MKKAIFLFCQFASIILLLFITAVEAYTYPGFWARKITFPFSIISIFLMAISGISVIVSAYFYKEKPLQKVYSVFFVLIWLGLYYLTNLNNQLIALTDNYEIFYLKYHFDGRVISALYRQIDSSLYLVILALIPLLASNINISIKNFRIKTSKLLYIYHKIIIFLKTVYIFIRKYTLPRWDLLLAVSGILLLYEKEKIAMILVFITILLAEVARPKKTTFVFIAAIIIWLSALSGRLQQYFSPSFINMGIILIVLAWLSNKK